MNQKVLFGLFVILTLTIQGCAMKPANTDGSDNMATGAMEATTGTETATMPEEKVAADPAQANETVVLSATYTTPGGDEPMEAIVTVANGVITAVDMKNTAINNVSKKYQDMFIAGIQGEIVGKNAKETQFEKVNGSSLTAKAFNKALHEKFGG